MTDANPFDVLLDGEELTGGGTEFDNLVDQYAEQKKREERQRFLETKQKAQTIDPARQAKAMAVAKERGVPVDVAYDNLDEYSAAKQGPDFDALLNSAPTTAKLVSDPVAGPVAMPDHKELSDIEKSLAAFSILRGLDKPKPTQPILDQMLGAGSMYLTPEQQKVEQEKRVKAAATELQAATEAERQANIIADNERKWREQNDPNFLFGGENYNPASDLTKSSAAARTADAKDSLELATKTPPEQKAAAAYINTVIRTLAGAGTTAAQGLSALADSLDYWLPVGSPELDKNGRSAATSYLAGLTDYIGELFPADKGRAKDLGMRGTEATASAVPFIAGGMGVKALGQSPGWFAGVFGALQQAGQGEADAVANGADINTKNLTTWLNLALGATEALPIEALFATASAGRKGLAQFLAATASNSAIEATQNTIQQVPADLWAQWMYDPKRDVWGNAIEAIKMGGLVGGLFGAAAGLINSDAESNHEKLISIGDAAKKARISEIAPEILEEHIAQLKKNGAAPEHVTAPAEAVETLFQELTPENLDLFPKTAQSLQEAKATGAEVTIPTEELVRLGKLNGYKNFAADVRIGDEMTLNETVKLREEVGNYLKEQDTATGPTAQDDSPIYKDMRQQLIKAGQTPEVATAQARLMDAFFSTQSERTGVPAADLARRYGLEVSNSAVAEAAGQTTLAQGDASPNFGEPAIKIGDQVFKASDYFPAWPKGDRPAAGRGTMSIADEQALAGTEDLGPGMPEDPFYGHVDLLAKARETLGADFVNQQMEQTPSSVAGFVNDAGEFQPLDRVDSNGRLKTTTLNQSAAVEPDGAGPTADPVTPDIAPAVDVASLDAANTLSKSKVWEKGRDLKMAMQEAVQSVLQKLGLNPIERSPEGIHYLTTVGTKDALAALEQNPNAIGWYDVKTRQALAVMALVHPEILKDENARFAFTWALAVTSNGIKVGKNFELADEVYKRFKTEGKMPTDVKAGNAQKAINESLSLFNDLRERWGIDNLRKFMLTDFTVKEITGVDPAIKPTGEAIDELVRGAAILGPKIGNGFFSNLYGNFDALTMDRWLVRTWGRWTGTLIELDQANIDKSRVRLREALKGVDRAALADALRALTKKTKTKGETELKPGDREALIQALRDLEYGRGKGSLEAGATTNVDALAAAVNKASMEPKFRSAMNEIPGGEELRKAGNALAKYLDAQKEQPDGPKERQYIREVFNNILANLRQDPKYSGLQMADLQAVLWYAEKRLYETAKEDAVVQGDEVADGEVSGYEDEEAPDYANAAANRARASGVSDRKINAALKREAENGRPAEARPGDAGTSGEAGPAVSPGEGGQQSPARGFARGEKRSFIQREALDRIRSNRGSKAEPSWSYTRASGGDGQGSRLLKSLGVSYVAEWKAGSNLGNVFRANGISTPTILELETGSDKNAAQFVSAITSARDSLGPIGEAVYIYPAEDYATMRLFVTKDGQSGFALKTDGDIVSVFSAKGAGNGRAVMETAIAAGGKKLDCFHTILPEFYSAHGFRPVARLLWADDQAPPKWDKKAMGEFNGGEPDVVFMVYDPTYNGVYDRKATPLKTGENAYDLALKAQARGVKAASSTTLNQGGKDVRGSITFTPLRDKFRITLTEKANLSTFIHEGGHFFLEVLQDLVERGEASAQQVADLKTLKRWMAVEDGKPIERAGHEKFARTWEQFIMEGKAPSLALHGIFQKFKAWMIFVYKRLANVRGDLNDEIRAVMDRLVASDAAIAEARAMVGWRGQPMSQEETGLTDAEYKAYVGEWTKANDAQSQDADARIMLEAARELKKTWTEEKAKVTREAEAQLAETRGWKVWKLLESGEGIEEFGRTEIKIDPDTIPKEWRRDTKGMTAPADQGGLDLDMVAELVGFDSGEQMLQAIGGAKLAQKAIPLRVRQIMVERYGEMDAAQLSQEAMKAVHNTPTMDVLFTEFRALAAKANLKVGKDTKRLVRAAAEERVAQLTARQLQPAKWRRAEVKAAEEAGKLAAKVQDTEAALAKRKQLMAAAMAKASLEAQDRIEAIKDYLTTFTTNRRRAALGKAGDTYLDQVDQILEAVQFKDVSLKAIKARQGLNEFVKEQEAAGEPVFISDATRDLLGRKNYTEMTLEELEGIHDAVKNLWTIAKEINTVRKGAEKIALENALSEIEKEAEDLLPVRKQRPHLENLKTKMDKLADRKDRYHAGNLKIEFVADWLGKTAHSLIYQPISNAAFESWKLHRDLTAPFMDKLRKMPKEQRARWNTKRQFLNYPMPLKGANIWAIALNMGNAGNKEKMLAGYGWTEAQVMAELNTFMTKEDWDLAQETWDTINSMWPKMSEVVKRATGLTPPKVEATPIETPFGTYRGGYFPVVYDTAIDARMDDKLDSSISPEEMFSKRFTAFVINNGFTKGRTANTGKLLFSPDVIADHLGEVIHYATHYDAVKQADKIIRAPAFKALVKTHLGDAVYAEMKQWLKDVATNTTRSDRLTDSGSRALRWLRNSAQLTSLGFNVLSALKQPLGIVNALDAVGPVHWAHGVQKALLSPFAVRNWKFAFQHSKELGPLVRSYDRDLAAISRSYADSVGNRAMQATYLAAFTPLSAMQAIANVATWHGAYQQATAQGMSEQEAYDAADKVVRTTQGSGALKDLTGMQRGGEASKLFTMFYSYFSIVYNRMADIQVREKGAKNLHRKAMRYTILLLIPSLLNMLADDAWDDMFHEDRAEKNDATPFLTRLALETVSSAVAAFPVAREFYSGAEAIFTGNRPRSLPAIGVLEQLTRAGSAAKDIAYDGDPLTRAKARSIVQATGILINQPIYGIYRAIDDVFGAKIFDE